MSVEKTVVDVEGLQKEGGDGGDDGGGDGGGDASGDSSVTATENGAPLSGDDLNNALNVFAGILAVDAAALAGAGLIVPATVAGVLSGVLWAASGAVHFFIKPRAGGVKLQIKAKMSLVFELSNKGPGGGTAYARLDGVPVEVERLPALFQQNRDPSSLLFDTRLDGY
jgi:hypothetical protein